jgi:hypothetical protein
MPPKKIKSQEELRGKSVRIRVNDFEHDEINQRAKMCCVTTSTYLRNIALNYPIKSRVDQLAFLELGKSRADLGRLGGLMKMWLSDKDRKLGLDEIDVKVLLKELEKAQELVTDQAKLLSKHFR